MQQRDVSPAPVGFTPGGAPASNGAMDNNLSSAVVVARTPLLAGSVAIGMREDGPFYAYIAVYVATVTFIAHHLGVQRKLIPVALYGGALQGLVLAVVFMVVVTGALSLTSPMPLQAWRRHLEAAAPLARAVALLMALGVFLCVFSSMKQMLTDAVPFWADPLLADVDAALHGGDPWRLTRAALPLALLPALEKAYLACWGIAVIGGTVLALFHPRLQRHRTRYVWATLLIWTVLGNLVAGILMSAGPVFYDEITGDTERFSDLNVYINTYAHQQWVQDLVWRSYSGVQPGVVGGGISAFPSMHVASTTLCAILLWQFGGWARWAGVAFASVILFGSVHLGWHYAVDGYFSILATIGIWKALGLVRARGLATEDTGDFQSAGVPEAMRMSR